MYYLHRRQRIKILSLVVRKPTPAEIPSATHAIQQEMQISVCKEWAQSCFAFALVVLQRPQRSSGAFVERMVLVTHVPENKSLKAQEGTLIKMGLGVGRHAKVGSELSQKHGKNRAFQEF